MIFLLFSFSLKKIVCKRTKLLPENDFFFSLQLKLARELDSMGNCSINSKMVMSFLNCFKYKEMKPDQNKFTV